MKYGLRQLGDYTRLGVKITDEFVDDFLGREQGAHSDELKECFISRLRVRIQDAAIREARRAADPKVIPFGQFIDYIRWIAGLTRAEVGERLGEKGEEFVQRVEQGAVSPVDLLPTDFVDLITLFRIKIKDAVQMVIASLQYADAKQEYGNGVLVLPGAIRHDDGSEDTEETPDPFENQQRCERISRRLRASNAAEAYFISLRKELVRRGRIRRLT